MMEEEFQESDDISLSDISEEDRQLFLLLKSGGGKKGAKKIGAARIAKDALKAAKKGGASKVAKKSGASKMAKKAEVLKINGFTDKKYENFLEKRRKKQEKFLLRTRFGILEDDEEFQPDGNLLKSLTPSIHAQSRIQLRDIERERLLGALNSPHLIRTFHCLSSVHTKQLTVKGELCILADSLLRLRYKDSDGHEFEVPQDTSLINCFLFLPDRSLIEESPVGAIFPVLIEFTPNNKVRTLVLDENNRTRMKQKFITVSKKRILYGNPDNPNRIALVVDPNFTTIITIIRYIENSEVCSVPDTWKNAIELTRLTEKTPEQHILFAPFTAVKHLFRRKKQIEKDTSTRIHIQKKLPTEGVSKVTIATCPDSVSTGTVDLECAVNDVKDILQFDDYERKLQRMLQKQEVNESQRKDNRIVEEDLLQEASVKKKATPQKDRDSRK